VRTKTYLFFRDWDRCISSSPRKRLPCFRSCIAKRTFIDWLQDGNQLHLVDCGPKTANGDLLQTEKPTDTVGTDMNMMAPCTACRVSTERREHTVWTWCDQWRSTSVEHHVKAASERGQTSGCSRRYVQLRSWLAAACRSTSLVSQSISLIFRVVHSVKCENSYPSFQWSVPLIFVAAYTGSTVSKVGLRFSYH